MDFNAQKNGLHLEDPLEELRNLFRDYWHCMAREDLEQASDIWKIKVPNGLESISQSHPEISREHLQTVFFEEKRRLQDHHLLADTIFEKMANYLNQIPSNPNEVIQDHSKTTRGASSESEPVRNDRIENQSQKPNTSKSPSIAGLDLTAMIDSMLEDERLLKQ